ncbi:hypothetical protein A6D6_04247 [Alcanivorax xiamenensis]|uniref:Metallo-beta-lactamase domain-containing protein n=1 Tax=Alcanivorax xiamenensis TaxID=1177156 RepID=A0ABQ6Y221_9GAMM|nr:MBL fold metallo-hydrolase [Alcanivorax xiamenensis]KAF0801771.1 hypothetical protein A6D6_04247 [Alcanivorax xiamenensis]
MSELQYPFSQPPQPGERLQVAPGVYWLYFPMPLALDHINLWLLEDGDGWTLVDTGFGTRHTQKIWAQAFDNALEGRPIRRIIVTHYHPDHVGQAGWLAQRFNAPVRMTRGEWELLNHLHSAEDDTVRQDVRRFMGLHGLHGEPLDALSGRGNGFRKVVPIMPPTPEFIAAGDVIQINGQTWRVHIGRGHAPEHACLFREHDHVLISGDQVLPRISSNLTVHARDPDDDPVSAFVDSLTAIKNALPEDSLVLPAHGLAFHGLHTRIDALVKHHDEQLSVAEEACEKAPLTAYDLLPLLFKRKLDNNQMMFAMGESIAHLNCLHAHGRATRADREGRRYYAA